MNTASKKTVFAFFILLSFSVAKSQSSINGKVTTDVGTPLSNATVLLMNAKDSSVIKGGLTNNEGLFLFKGIMPGNYLLSSSYTNYEQTFNN